MRKVSTGDLMRAVCPSRHSETGRPHHACVQSAASVVARSNLALGSGAARQTGPAAARFRSLHIRVPQTRRSRAPAPGRQCLRPRDHCALKNRRELSCFEPAVRQYRQPAIRSRSRPAFSRRVGHHRRHPGAAGDREDRHALGSAGPGAATLTRLRSSTASRLKIQ